MKLSWAKAVACTTMLLASCSTLPKFNLIPRTDGVVPRVSDIIDEVQCEVLVAVDNGQNADSPLAGLQSGQYVASVNLTLDVTNNQGVNPALSFISPFVTAGTNVTGLVNGQLSGQQHRNFTVNFTVVFDRNTPTTENINACNEARRGLGLRGDLGIAEILETGLRYSTGFKYDNKYPYKMPALDVGTFLIPNDPLTNSSALAPAFGSTVDFTIIYGLGGGPNWTLTHFIGPQSSGSLVSLLRTDKDTLIISFARIPPPVPTLPSGGAISSAPAPVEAAGISAQQNITRMILQRITVP